MANEKLEFTNTAITVLSFLLAALGALISKIISFTKERADFVTKKQLDKTLEAYARKDMVDELKNEVRSGFDRLENHYIEDKKLSQERELAYIRRIDEAFDKR